MPADISIKVRTEPTDLAKIISDAPRMARGRMTKAAAVYLIGNQRRGLKHYSAYRYVTRRRAYGKPFFSRAQQALVMARIRSGRIDPGYPHRTGRLQRGWTLLGSGAKVQVVNTEDYADVVMGEGQSRHEKLGGWRQYFDVIETSQDGMVQEAERELAKYYKEKGVSVK